MGNGDGSHVVLVLCTLGMWHFVVFSGSSSWQYFLHRYTCRHVIRLFNLSLNKTIYYYDQLSLLLSINSCHIIIFCGNIWAHFSFNICFKNGEKRSPIRTKYSDLSFESSTIDSPPQANPMITNFFFCLTGQFFCSLMQTKKYFWPSIYYLLAKWMFISSKSKSFLQCGRVLTMVPE